jgi:hypothetical protein
MMQFRQINTPDKNLQLIQDNVQSAIVQLSQTPFVGGVLLSSLQLTASAPVTVAHGLGRAPTVWIVCGKNSNSNIWSTTATATTITFSCSANTVANIWVN